MKKLMLIMFLLSFGLFAQTTNLTNLQLSGSLAVTGASSITSLTATGATVLGAVSLEEDLTVGHNVFTTTAETDTVLISGATTADIYIVTGVFTSAIDQQDILQAQAITGGLVVHRMAAGESALKYNWLRFTVH